MVWTRRDVLVECECQSRCMWRGGQRPGAVVAHAHPAYLYPGALMMQTYFEYFGILGISLPPPDSDETLGRSVEFLKRFKPDRSAMAFSHSRFVEYAARHGLDAREDLGLVETSPSSGIPLASAGLECFGPLGSACSNQRGAHIAEDHAVVEALDPTTGRSVPDGEWGNLVVTTFGRDSCHLRYDLQEAVRIERTECGCGETSIRAWWGGRFKDIVSTQGSSFTFLDVNAVLSDPAIALDTPTAEYVVVRPASSDAPVALYLESRDPANTTLNDRVATSLNERLGVKFEVTLIPEQTLARAEYKQERLVDRPPSVG